MLYLDTLVRNLAVQITQPRRYLYSQETLDEYLSVTPDILCSKHSIKNTRQETLEAMLLYQPRPPTKSPATCIIYAHGLGSNKLQALPVIRYFQALHYDICAFDFSSSGRSEGQFTSYGLREQDDVVAVLNYLDRETSYEKYVLWGRSMGAVAIVLSQGLILHRKVQSIVLDSPFSNFQKIAVQLASKKSSIPEFMLGMMIDPLKQYFQTSHPVNPFSIDICAKISRIDCKIMFVYSQSDTIVPCHHSRSLIELCRQPVHTVEIQEDHNMHRSKSTYHAIYQFVRQCEEDNDRRATRLSRVKNRGISVTSVDNKRKDGERSRGNSCHRTELRETFDKRDMRDKLSKESLRSGVKIQVMSSNPLRHTMNKESSLRRVGMKAPLSLANESFLQHSSCEISLNMSYDCKLNNMLKIKSICLNNVNISLNSNKGGSISSNKEYPNNGGNPSPSTNKENLKPSFNMIRKNRFH